MRTMSRLGWFVSFLLTTGSPARPATQTPATEVTHWELDVRPLRGSEELRRVSLWLGVKNVSSEARVFCVSSLNYNLSHRDEPEGGGTVWPGSPHACRVGEQKHLVLAGQTHFRMAVLPIGEAPQSDAAKLELFAEGYEYAVPSLGKGKAISLKWTGSVMGR